jgi:hypothetical protein
VGIDALAGPVTDADRTTDRPDLREPLMATGWVYVLGERNGVDLKIGYTDKSKVRDRVKGVVDSWNGQRDYVLLAAVRGTKKDEKAMRSAFRIRTDLGPRTEYIWPDECALEYANWLRSQWFAATDDGQCAEDVAVVDPSHWMPGDGRRTTRPDDDPDTLLQTYELRNDGLAETAWTWMVNPAPSIQDYYTPPPLIDAARIAMDGIDLDAASHWIANKTHKIPDYFHVNRSAFENPWHGRVWLNPPYGDNAPWFREILRYTSSGDVEQLCMLSPVWAFTTAIARPVVNKSSGFVMLNPTPKFWGNARGREGTNNPHGILYIGERSKDFFRAFEPYGYPMEFRWDAMDELRSAA